LIFIEAQVDLIENLANIDPIGNSSHLLELLIVGLMQDDTVWIAILHKVKDLLADQHNALVPFALYVVGSFVMDCGEDLGRCEDSIGKEIVGIEVSLLSQLQLHGFPHLYSGRF
jgi:hypothetical protein